MEGWLKLHRSIADHWIYSFKEPDKALAWIDLLIMARHTDGIIMLKGRALELKRGQVGLSQLAMQKRWGWSQNKVKRFLTLLKKHSMCDFVTNDLTTVITICNFDNFQSDGRADERPNGRADERTTDDQSNDDIRMREGLNGNNRPLSPNGNGQARQVPYEQIREIYNAQLPTLTGSRILSPKAKRNIERIWKLDQRHQNREFWTSYFGGISQLTSRMDNWSGVSNGNKSGNIELVTREEIFIRSVDDLIDAKIWGNA